MPSSLLFGINNEGRVFGLSTNGTKWREFVYLGLEFKQLSAVPHSLWAVGGDRQIYVHVHGLDIPIRVKEEAYENERWTPVHGFSHKLLPTDRYNFSSIDGTKDRTLKKIKLPSMAWQWEGDWHLESTLDGQPLDHDGWTYAVDFPATYHVTKQWTSCVRRRKWIRYRRYSALNSWCAISPLHKDATQEPFIGISAGGHEAGFDGGRLSVWAVTAHGRLMFRTEVSTTSPEGQRWNVISIPGNSEVLQVTVGATGLVWVCLQNGKALARTGITRDCIIGNGWTEIAAPETNLSLMQVSLGTNSLWAVTKDHRVWFRSGIRGEMSGVSENLAKGSVWVEMIGRMDSLSVAPNDQVFAIGENDRLLYFRTGVTQETLTGKTWRQVGAPTQLSRTSSVASLFSAGSTVTPREKRHRSWTSLNRHSGSHETARLELDLDGACHSAPAFTRPMACNQAGSLSGALSSLPAHATSSVSGLPNSLHEEPEFPIHPVEIHEVKPRRMEPNDVYEDTSHPVVGFTMSKDQWIKRQPHAMSPLRSVGSIVGVEAHTETDSSVFESEAMVGVYGEFGEREEEDDYLYWADSEAFWNAVEAGACIVHPSHLPNWFAELPGHGNKELEQPWRLKILEELRHRVPQDITEEHCYERAVDTSSWVKTANVRCLVGEVWQEAALSLEWVEGEGSMDCGTLTISCPNAAATYAQCSVAELNAVVRCSEPCLPRIGLHRGVDIPPIKLQFSGEDELEEWLAEIHELCCHVRKMGISPGPETLWVTTMLGDVHAFDSADLQAEQGTDKGFKLEIPLSSQALPITIPLYSGFTVGTELKIHGCVPDGADRFSFNLVCGSPDGDVAFHLNPRIVEEFVVRNARKNGVWGPEDRRGVQPFTTGTAFVLQMVCEEASVRVAVDDKHFTNFNFRGIVEDDMALAPSSITYLVISGDVAVTKLEYLAFAPIFHPPSMYFRHIGGHLRKVASAGGVTWGIGYDNTAWYYVGGTGGPLLKGTQPGWNLPMVDSHTYFVYENQRWNPLTGYTSHGLPTDRHMWSDVTGRHKRTREKTKLLSQRWQWELDWSVDYTTPGEVDKEGWQYAVDFPATYHGTKHLTDYVRRRRWKRRARLVTTGPWRELGHTPLVDCCLHVEEGGEIVAWGSALNGDVLFRKGVSTSCPAGLAWEHVSCDEPITALSSSPGQLWGVGRSGGAFWRFDISSQNPIGSSWLTVDAPKGVTLKSVSVGTAGVWALDTTGRLSVRKEVSRVFPSGSSWQTLPLYSGESAADEGETALPTTPLGVPSGGFRYVNVGSRVWAITGTGRLLYRLNVSEENAAGSAWVNCLDASLSHCSGV